MFLDQTGISNSQFADTCEIPRPTLSQLLNGRNKKVSEEVIGKMGDGTNVLFDLSRMEHIDSSGLGVLVQILQKAKAGGGKVVLAALQSAPKIVFDITKVSRVFEIVPTVADAHF